MYYRVSYYSQQRGDLQLMRLREKLTITRRKHMRSISLWRWNAKSSKISGTGAATYLLTGIVYLEMLQ
jgi:hypothetical protein